MKAFRFLQRGHAGYLAVATPILLLACSSSSSGPPKSTVMPGDAGNDASVGPDSSTDGGGFDVATADGATASAESSLSDALGDGTALPVDDGALDDASLADASGTNGENDAGNQGEAGSTPPPSCSGTGSGLADCGPGADCCSPSQV